MTLKKRAFVASMWSLLGNGGRQLITFVLFVYVARKVTPADVGLVAFAMIAIDILGFASRLGQVEALQRRSDVTDAVLSTSFWLLAPGGLLITGAIILAAKALTGSAEDSVFGHVLILLAPICALQAWNAVPEAILKRRLDYRSLAARTWLATLLGGLLGVYLAYRGFGVYALVGQRVMTALVQTVTVWAMLRWYPRWQFRGAEARILLHVGVSVMVANFSATVNKRIVDGITGAVLGMAQLGHFNLGWRFNNFIVQFAVTPISAVALTMFASVQHDRERFKRLYLRLTQFAALASLPLFFGLAVTADLLVPVVLGDKWAESIVVMRLLGFVMLGGTVNYFFAPAMIAAGHVHVVMRQATVQILGTALFVFVGAQFGILGVLVAIIARTLMVAVYNTTALHRTIGLSIVALLRVLMPPVVAAGAMVLAVEYAKLELAGQISDALLLVVLVAVGAAAYGAALVLGDAARLWRGYVRDTIESVTGVISRRPTQSATIEPA